MIWRKADLGQRLLKMLRNVPSGTSVLLVGGGLKKLAVDYIEEALKEGEYVVYVTDFPCTLEIESSRCGIVQLYDVLPAGGEKLLRTQLMQPRLKTTSIVNLTKVSVFIRDYFKEMMDDMLVEMRKGKINLVVDNLISMLTFDTHFSDRFLRFLRLHIDVIKSFDAVGLYFLEQEVPVMKKLEALFEDGMIIWQDARGKLKIRS